jgi:hypothetical protein
VIDWWWLRARQGKSWFHRVPRLVESDPLRVGRCLHDGQGKALMRMAAQRRGGASQAARSEVGSKPKSQGTCESLCSLHSQLLLVQLESSIFVLVCLFCGAAPVCLCHAVCMALLLSLPVCRLCNFQEVNGFAKFRKMSSLL